MLHMQRMIAHRCRTAGDLVDRFGLGALGGERREEGSVLRRGGFAVHDLIHDIIGFVIGQVFFINNLFNCICDHFRFLLFCGRLCFRLCRFDFGFRFGSDSIGIVG